MLSLEQIRQIQNLDAGDGRILSLYLNLEPARQSKRAYRIVFKKLVKETRARLDEALQIDLQLEAEKVARFLDGHKPQGLGLALFSCESNIWLPLWLALRTHDHLSYDSLPDVAPLLEILDDYERYVVVLTDKQTTRLFTIFADELEEDSQIKIGARRAEGADTLMPIKVRSPGGVDDEFHETERQRLARVRPGAEAGLPASRGSGSILRTRRFPWPPVGPRLLFRRVESTDPNRRRTLRPASGRHAVCARRREEQRPILDRCSVTLPVGSTATWQKTLRYAH